jgi:glycosyltransferase involved in cell wall biosynthesis
MESAADNEEFTLLHSWEITQPNATSQAISNPYLLVVWQMPLYRDASGRLFADQLWGVDLLRHLEYLTALSIVCPCLNQTPPPDAVCLDSSPNRLNVIEVPVQNSFLQSLRLTPRIILALWRGVRNADIVHTGIEGWPIPIGWIAASIALIQRKILLINVESASWRLQPGSKVNWKVRLRSILHERVGCWLISRTDLPLFTQDEYRQSLLGSDSARGFVIPASWIDDADVISDDEAERLWQNKLHSGEPRLRILFAGRLTVKKGVPVLLQSIRLLAEENQGIELDILGDGDLEADCKEACRIYTGSTSVRMLGTVSYGAPLFHLLRNYDAVVVPSISDEQPRIVFDTYSQGVPVIASDTTGLRSCVNDGVTGLLFPPGDPAALANLMRFSPAQREILHRLGISSIKLARGMTHRTMHQRRAALIHAFLHARNDENVASVGVT